MSSSRHYPKLKSRSVPTKVRRRQSDAKWRASVQSCYESLKLIIPESRRSNKRKLSKAVILQEAECHILYLEDVLTTLLEEKEKQIDHGLILPSKMSPSTFQEIKDEFVMKSQPPLQHIPKSKKVKAEKRQSECCSPYKCKSRVPPSPPPLLPPPSEPEKIICTLFQGDQYYYLSGKTLCLQRATPSKSERTHHLYDTKQIVGMTVNESSAIVTPGAITGPYFSSQDTASISKMPCSPSIHSSSSSLSATDNSDMSFLERVTQHFARLDDKKAEVFLPQMTPNKNDPESDNINHCSPWHAAAMTSSIHNHPAFLTPSKVTRKLPFDVGSPSSMSLNSPKLKLLPGSPVTPIPKEPLFHFQFGDNFMEVPSTPTLKSEDVVDGGRDDTSSLLCTESIETMELGDETERLKEQCFLGLKNPNQGDVHLTPCSDLRAEASCCPSEQELQDRPKKADVKKRNLFPVASDNEMTPAKYTRIGDKPKCRKQLESLYDQENDIFPTPLPLNVISIPSDTSECSNFDGYFYFYRQMSGALENHLNQEEMRSPTFAETISQMWNDMNEDQKTTLVTIAALENSNSSSSTSTELKFQVVPCELLQTNKEGDTKEDVLTNIHQGNTVDN
ncbi:uncharacterized protein LOC135470549 isoform X2 [Liolophura sinensis]|uniref:uncharacterized protein LOC135470549 isoform X2 n=1 Tax=Liolophura sinensis TaxID=3198878 RepID=UPI003158E721